MKKGQNNLSDYDRDYRFHHVFDQHKRMGLCRFWDYACVSFSGTLL
jgi:hypothetical protein